MTVEPVSQVRDEQGNIYRLGPYQGGGQYSAVYLALREGETPDTAQAVAKIGKADEMRGDGPGRSMGELQAAYDRECRLIRSLQQGFQSKGRPCPLPWSNKGDVVGEGAGQAGEPPVLLLQRIRNEWLLSLQIGALDGLHRELLAARSGAQYADLLDTLHNGPRKRSSDRKPLDFYWDEAEQHLYVLDWNTVQDFPDDEDGALRLAQSDVRALGKWWFEMLVGVEPEQVERLSAEEPGTGPFLWLRLSQGMRRLLLRTLASGRPEGLRTAREAYDWWDEYRQILEAAVQGQVGALQAKAQEAWEAADLAPGRAWEVAADLADLLRKMNPPAEPAAQIIEGWLHEADKRCSRAVKAAWQQIEAGEPQQAGEALQREREFSRYSPRMRLSASRFYLMAALLGDDDVRAKIPALPELKARVNGIAYRVVQETDDERVAEAVQALADLENQLKSFTQEILPAALFARLAPLKLDLEVVRLVLQLPASAVLPAGQTPELQRVTEVLEALHGSLAALRQVDALHAGLLREKYARQLAELEEKKCALEQDAHRREGRERSTRQAREALKMLGIKLGPAATMDWPLEIASLVGGECLPLHPVLRLLWRFRYALPRDQADLHPETARAAAGFLRVLEGEAAKHDDLQSTCWEFAQDLRAFLTRLVLRRVETARWPREVDEAIAIVDLLQGSLPQLSCPKVEDLRQKRQARERVARLLADPPMGDLEDRSIDEQLEGLAGQGIELYDPYPRFQGTPQAGPAADAPPTDSMATPIGIRELIRAREQARLALWQDKLRRLLEGLDPNRPDLQSAIEFLHLVEKLVSMINSLRLQDKDLSRAPEGVQGMALLAALRGAPESMEPRLTETTGQTAAPAPGGSLTNPEGELTGGKETPDRPLAQADAPQGQPAQGATVPGESELPTRSAPITGPSQVVSGMAGAQVARQPDATTQRGSAQEQAKPPGPGKKPALPSILIGAAVLLTVLLLGAVGLALFQRLLPAGSEPEPLLAPTNTPGVAPSPVLSPAPRFAISQVLLSLPDSLAPGQDGELQLSVAGQSEGAKARFEVDPPGIVQVDPAEVDVSGGVARARLKALGPEGTVQVRASVEGMATTQSLRVASPPRLELSLAADPSELVTPSETVTVTVSLKNVGKRAVQGVRVACQVPFAATFIMGATQKEGTEVEYVLPDALKAGQTAEGALRLRMQIPATARETATLRCQVSAEGM
ncbi:MAG TPA: hypothetical protein PLG21_08350, partial [Anaerolineae bacterium]|nr:hypothetical protein [Anaerolineae bacterium]